VDKTELDVALLVGSGVLLVAVGGVRLASRIGVPGLLIYLFIGMALGEDGAGLHFDDAQLARNIGLVALALILAEGGLTTSWSDFRSSLPLAAALSTIGVGVSVAVTAVIAHVALDLSWRGAALIGAVVSSTDAAAVFSTLRGLRLPRRLVGLLEAESGLNDAPTVILVTLLSARHPHGLGTAIATVGYELAIGAAIGVVVGVGGAEGLRRADRKSVV